MSDTPEPSAPITSQKKEVTPLSCFFASIIAGGIATMIYFLMSGIVETYANKPVLSSSVLAIKIATAVRTLVIGIAALGTGVFGIVAVGLFLLGIQVTIKSITGQASNS